MSKITANDLMPMGEKRDVLGGGIAHNIDGDIVLIDENGRNELVVKAKVCETEKGLYFIEKETILVDKGISLEEVRA